MKATFKEFTINTRFDMDKPSGWDERNWNHHTVTVYSKTTGKRTSFDFWGSIMNPEIDSEYDTLNAFYCFVSDALSGTYSFSEFCGEFGYDEDSRKAEKAWKACQRSLKKFERVSGYGLDEMYDFINELSEVAA